MASRKKKVELPKFIIVTEATYINSYVIQAKSLEDAHAIYETMKDNMEEHTMPRVQQCMQEDIVDMQETC
jgi:hypothetical protein